MIEKRRNAEPSNNLKDQREYAMPLWTQVYTVTYRNFAAYWRSPDYLIGKFMLHIFTGLFNTFTFWHLGNSQIDMQSRLFSIFMTLTISPPLIQQLQPRYLNLRNIYKSRERNSKIYSWFAFTTAAVLPELPWSFVAGTIYWCCWYWATWFPRDTYTSVSVWLFVSLFEVYYVSFGQMIASFAPNELLASILVSPQHHPLSPHLSNMFNLGPPLLPFRRLLLRRRRPLRRPPHLLALLDVLALPLQIPPRRPPRSHHPRRPRHLLRLRTRAILRPARPDLPKLRGALCESNGWLCHDFAGRVVWVLSVSGWGSVCEEF